MATKLGILVGHCGQGTGATWQNRDEWMICNEDAHTLAGLCGGELEPVVISLDRSVLPWSLFRREFRGRLRNVDIRADWAITAGCHVVVELHLNSYTNLRAEGHEVWVRGEYSRMLGESIYRQMGNVLGNTPRGVKSRITMGLQGFRLLGRLKKASIPACILEPAFIFENNFVSLERRRQYLIAVRDGITDFIGG